MKVNKIIILFILVGALIVYFLIKELFKISIDFLKVILIVLGIAAIVGCFIFSFELALILIIVIAIAIIVKSRKNKK